jgi:hypothetical protein
MIRHLAVNVHYTLVPISGPYGTSAPRSDVTSCVESLAAYHALKSGRSRRTSYGLTDPA